MRYGRSRPFSLSAPSWVLPGTYLENLEALARIPTVDSVELLFFSYDKETRDLLARELEGISRLEGRFGYTLHLPDPLLPEHEELVGETRGIVRQYVFHPSSSPEKLACVVDSFRVKFGDAFLLENTDEALFEASVKMFSDIKICCDTGRLLLAGNDPAAWIGARKEGIGEIHLHGTRGGKDHAPVKAGEPWMRRLGPFFASYSGIVEIEVFDIEGFTNSAAELEGLCEGYCARS